MPGKPRRSGARTTYRSREAIRESVRNAHAVGPIYVELSAAYLAVGRFLPNDRESRDDLYDKLARLEPGGVMRLEVKSDDVLNLRTLVLARGRTAGRKLTTSYVNGVLRIERLA